MADTFNFEVFDKRATPLIKRPEVTIQSGGALSLNKSAFHALGEPKAIELLYDRAKRVIGFRSVDENAVHAYPIRGFGSGNTYIVSGRAFLAFYEIPMGSPVRREAKMVNGVLIIDLNDPGRDATSNRNRKKRADEKAAAVEDLTAMAAELRGPANETLDNNASTVTVAEPVTESQNGAVEARLALANRPGGVLPLDEPGRSLLPGSATGGSTG